MSFPNYAFNNADSDKQIHQQSHETQRALDLREFPIPFENGQDSIEANIKSSTPETPVSHPNITTNNNTENASVTASSDKNTTSSFNGESDAQKQAKSNKRNYTFSSTFSSFPLLSSTSLSGADDPAYKCQMAPPPMIYCSVKQPLLEFAKLFANIHGYKLATVKNDSKRCILRCTKHNMKENQNQASNSGEDAQEDNDHTPCDFRVEIQLKKRKGLWLLKPLTTTHNHTDMIHLPHMYSGYMKSLQVPKASRESIMIENFCQCSDHISCIFEENFHCLTKLFSTTPDKIFSEERDGGIRILNDITHNFSEIGMNSKEIMPNLSVMYQGSIDKPSSGVTGVQNDTNSSAQSAQEKYTTNDNEQTIPSLINDALSRDINYNLMDETPGPPNKKTKLTTPEISMVTRTGSSNFSLNFKLVIYFCTNHLSVLLELQNFIILKNNECLDYSGLEYSFVPLTRDQMMRTILQRSHDSTENMYVDSFIIDVYDLSDKSTPNLIESNIVTVYNYDEMFNVVRSFNRFLKDTIKQKLNVDLAESFM